MSASLTSQQAQQNLARQATTLKEIENLQKMEQALYRQLEAASAAGNPSADQDAVIARINSLAQMRVSLFESLDQMYKIMQGRVAQSRVDLVDQITVAKVAEQQMNQAKKSLEILHDEKNEKMRMVEINTYYGDRYRAHTDLMKLVTLFAAIVLVLAILRKQTWLPIPDNIMTGLIALTIAIGIFMVVRRMWDLSSRNNMNYQEYEWSWDPASYDPTVIQYDAQQLGLASDSISGGAAKLANMAGLGCIGKSCCSNGTKWDDSSKKCIEGFTTRSADFPVSYIESESAKCPDANPDAKISAYNSSSGDYVGF